MSTDWDEEQINYPKIEQKVKVFFSSWRKTWYNDGVSLKKEGT
jgi:hypothetical protein